MTYCKNVIDVVFLSLFFLAFHLIKNIILLMANICAQLIKEMTLLIKIWRSFSTWALGDRINCL